MPNMVFDLPEDSTNVQAKNYITYSEGATYTSTPSYASYPSLLTDDDLLGRKIKFHMNTRDETVSPWWQGKNVVVGDIAYSNGHYYISRTEGTTGNVQPSHTEGTRSDGKIDWEYLHSGTGTATITEVVSSTELKAIVAPGESLPILDKAVVGGKYRFPSFQWSIIGYRGVYPSHIFSYMGRLGLFINTMGYGAWKCLSCTDDYFNFSTEQYGEQLDTSAIITLVPDNDDGKINWVIPASRLYYGGHSGEFVTSPVNGGITPVSDNNVRINETGGSNVRPLRYKELNLFVGSERDQIYSIGYDYTIDDYTPKEIGLFVDHLLNNKIRRMSPLNNKDQNIYIVQGNNKVSLLKYSKSQRILSYSRLESAGENVLDFTAVQSGEIKTAYVALTYGDDKIKIERVATQEPVYMFDAIATESDSVDVEYSTTDISTDIQNGQWTLISYGDNFVDFVEPTNGGFPKKHRLFRNNGVELTEVTQFKLVDTSDDPNLNATKIIAVYNDGFIMANVGSDKPPYVSYDYGANWTLGNSVSNVWGTNHNPKSVARIGDTLYITTDGGAYRSINKGVDWVFMNPSSEEQRFANSMFFINYNNKLYSFYGQTRWDISPFRVAYTEDGEAWTEVTNDTEEHHFYHEPNIIAARSNDEYIHFLGPQEQFWFSLKDGHLIGHSDFSSATKTVGFLADNEYFYCDDAICVYQINRDGTFANDGIPNVITEIVAGKRTLSTDEFVFTGNNVGYFVPNYGTDSFDGTLKRIDRAETLKDSEYIPVPYHANKEVYVKYGDDLGQFVKVTLDENGDCKDIPKSKRFLTGLPMVCELHTQPAFGNKVEGMAQQSLSIYLRLKGSGSFQYGSSVDFNTYYDYKVWSPEQNYNVAPILYTGDLYLNIPMGYTENQVKPDSLYPNTSGVGINIKTDTPEPFNLLAIQEIYK